MLRKKECRVDGLIISNTTVERPDSLRSNDLKHETGGLSGVPLKDVSTQMIADMYKLTDKMTIIGMVSLYLIIAAVLVFQICRGGRSIVRKGCL